MDIIAEALEQINSSHHINSLESTRTFLLRAQALAILAVATSLESIADKLPDKELSNTKRIVITLNDDTTQEQIDTLINDITQYNEFHSITAVIVYEEGGK